MTHRYILMISFDQWWLCYPPGSGAYPADCRHSWGSSGCTSGRTSTGTWAMWIWSLSAFLRGGQIHILSWTLSGNVFPFWRMRQTHTRTCLPLTNKHSQTHIDIHKYTLIDTHKHIHTHKLTHTKTNACTQCFPIKAGYNLRSDWEWNVNLKKIRMQDLQGGFLTGSPLN